MKSVKFLFIIALAAMSVFFAKAQVPSNMSQSAFFTTKFTKEKVWDVQRSPAYPIAGQDWTLSGLKGALDANRTKINWGTGRYLMFELVPDVTNNPNSLVDDVNKSNVKYNVSLKLFESNGNLVYVVSKWGKLIGMGDRGFMYEVEGKYGSFFSATAENASNIIKYKSNLAAVTKLSDIVKTGILKVNLECPFFTAKYTKDKVWDVQRSPAYPVAGQEWTLSGLKGAYEANGAFIDWGVGRYVMFVAETENVNASNSINDDKYTSGAKYNVTLKLFESNGTFVKVVSKWGKIIGMGDKGFMYEEEGRYGTFFTLNSVNASTAIKYKPAFTAPNKTSELAQVNSINPQPDPTPSGGIIFNPNSTYGTMSDIDGNTYKTIQIGNQTWMAENLKTTKYKDGSAIPNVTDNTAWSILTTAAYSWYNNDIANKADRGAIYNGFAANTGKLCPNGWHVPSKDEWTDLIKTLGGAKVAGGKMKETGTTHWASPNTGATNESGFTAVPGGQRMSGTFYHNETGLVCWTTSKDYVNQPISIMITYRESKIDELNLSNTAGRSVRCIKDEDNSDNYFNPNLNYGSMTDQDGNTYKTIKIGNQTWMAENLKTTKYRNGEAIQNITDNNQWSNSSTGAYCWYNNDITNKKLYGALYNGYSAADSRNLCPSGWHIANDTEWKDLIKFLALEPHNDFKIRATRLWKIKPDGDNSSGFTALPGGFRSVYGGSFSFIFSVADWWSSSKIPKIANAFEINNGPIFTGRNLGHGYSIRCVKD